MGTGAAVAVGCPFAESEGWSACARRGICDAIGMAGNTFCGLPLEARGSRSRADAGSDTVGNARVGRVEAIRGSSPL